MEVIDDIREKDEKIPSIMENTKSPEERSTTKAKSPGNISDNTLEKNLTAMQKLGNSEEQLESDDEYYRRKENEQMEA